MLLSLNTMKRVYYPALLTQVLLTLMQYVPMYQDQSPRLDLPNHILLLLLRFLVLKVARPPLITLHLVKSSPTVILFAHETLLHGRSPMRPRRKTKAAI